MVMVWWWWRRGGGWRRGTIEARTRQTTRTPTEVDVARVVVVLKVVLVALDVVDLLGRRPAVGRTRGLGERNEEDERFEEVWHLLAHGVEVADRRDANLAAKERVEGLGDKEADNREHGDAAVGHLGLAVALHLIEGAALRETSRVELGDRVEGAREAPREGVLVRHPAVEVAGRLRVDADLSWARRWASQRRAGRGMERRRERRKPRAGARCGHAESFGGGRPRHAAARRGCHATGGVARGRGTWRCVARWRSSGHGIVRGAARGGPLLTDERVERVTGAKAAAAPKVRARMTAENFIVVDLRGGRAPGRRRWRREGSVHRW